MRKGEKLRLRGFGEDCTENQDKVDWQRLREDRKQKNLRSKAARKRRISYRRSFKSWDARQS
jgi:hypothetical protein